MKTKTKNVKVTKITKVTKKKPAKVKKVTPVTGTVTTVTQELKPIRGRYEGWSYDEYGQGSIVKFDPNLAEVVKEIKKYVTDLNVGNALTQDERNKSWDAYYPVVWVDGQPSTTVLYAGNKIPGGKHHLYVREGDKWRLTVAPIDTEYRLFLGETDTYGKKEDWYLTDAKSKPITSLSVTDIERKTIFFVKVA